MFFGIFLANSVGLCVLVSFFGGVMVILPPPFFVGLVVFMCLVALFWIIRWSIFYVF
jgi:hypothetical protein